MTTENKVEDTFVGKVTHLMYSGMMFHVIGDRKTVDALIAEKTKIANGPLIYLDVVASDGKVESVGFGVFGPMLLLDDHDWKMPSAMPIPGLEIAEKAASVSI